MTLTDASGVGAKTWNFFTSGPKWQLGLVSEFVQSTAAGGTVLQDDVYTWAPDTIGRPHLSAKTTTTGQGTSNVVSAYSTQAVDDYGNTTQSAIYPYNNTTTPLQTWNNTYLTTPGYLANYVFNLLSTTTMTPGGGSPITLVTNTYDHCSTLACYTAPPPGSTPREYDASSPVPYAYRGLLYAAYRIGKAATSYYYPWGTFSWGQDTTGAYITASANATTNFSAPLTITAQSYSETVAYTPWLGVYSTTGANGEFLAMSYDAYGRPSGGTSAYGATTGYTYASSAPFWQKVTGPNGVTTTTLDGFGRAIRVASGDTTGDKSWTDSVYAPCAWVVGQFQIGRLDRHRARRSRMHSLKSLMTSSMNAGIVIWRGVISTSKSITIPAPSFGINRPVTFLSVSPSTSTRWPFTMWPFNGNPESLFML